MTAPAAPPLPRARVVITQHRLLHYRQTFFDRLRTACAERGVELRLVHGQASPTEAAKQDVGELPWADVVRNRFLRLGGRDLVWQPFPRDLRSADLVVLMQENRLLSNYPWLLRFAVGPGQRIAYWGHGRNLQSASPNSLRERWKRWFATRVDWWFAYTESTRCILHSDGFPDGRITVLNNAIDNQEFARELQAVDAAQAAECRTRLGANSGAPIGLYCGSLYEDKRLGLLLAAADIIYNRRADFRLVIVGDGPGRSLIAEAAKSRTWLHWVGAQRGIDKARWFRVASAYLSPGAVGLHVLDAFCAGIPMITTADARHGPEIAYLETGRNGLIVEAKAQAYADAFLSLLNDPKRYEAIRGAAALDAQRYTLDAMVERFVGGIEGCLAAARYS